MVLKTYSDEQHEDTAHVVMAWRDLDDGDGTSFVLDPREDEGVPAGSRVTEHRVPSWSEDGGTIFLGLQDRKPVENAEGEEEGEGEEDEEEGEEEGEGDEEGEGEREGGVEATTRKRKAAPQARAEEEETPGGRDLAFQRTDSSQPAGGEGSCGG